MNAIEVKITGCKEIIFWYRYAIGETFMVYDTNGDCVCVVQTAHERNQGITRMIKKYDCEPTGKINK